MTQSLAATWRRNARSARLAVVAATLVVALYGSAWPGAQQASAASFTVKACDFPYPNSSTLGRWSLPYFLGVWRPVIECPDAVRLEMRSQVATSSSVGITTSIRTAGMNVTAMKFTMDGGDTTNGAKVYAFPNPLYNADVQLPDRDPGEPPETVEVDLVDSDTFGLRLRCTAASCPAADPFVFRDFEFTFDDSTAPAMGGPWTNLAAYGPLKVDQWNTPTNVNMKFVATDGGTGVRRTKLTTTGFVRNLNNTCLSGTEWATPLICPQQAPEFSGSLYSAAMSDGWHNLDAEAVDALGNTRILDTERFAVDGTPPPRPSYVQVDGLSDAGWTRNLTNSLTWQTSREAVESDTESGIVATRYDVDPADDAPGMVDPQAVTGPPFGIDNLALPGDGRWDVWISQVDRAGNVGLARGVSIGRDTDVPPAPEVVSPGWVSRQALIDGFDLHWTRPAVTDDHESGICGYSMAFGGDPAGAEPNVLGDVTSGQVPANLSEGWQPVKLRVVSCAGLASDPATGEIGVDGAPPEVSVSGDGIGEWTTSTARVVVSARDDVSGVTDLRYAIDGGPEIAGEPGGTTLELADGVHTVRVYAIDRAGNRSADATSTVLVDTNLPSAWFEPRDPAQPSKIFATVEDGGSGIASARLEYARVDAGASEAERAWRRFGQVVEPSTTDARRIAMSARLPDESLPDGAYLLRAVVVDRAGNVTAGTASGQGREMRLDLPVRDRPSLSAALAGFKKACTMTRQRRRVCRKSSSVDVASAVRNRLVAFGESAALVGEFRRSNGDVVPGIDLDVYEEPKFGKRTTAGVAGTDARGRFVFRPSRGRSRTFIVRYPGDATTLPVEARAVLGVRGGVHFRVSPKRAKVGRVLVFSGRLTSGGDGMPTSGKIVFIKYLVGGVWRPAVASPKTDLKGRFRELYPLTQKVNRPTRLRFRVEVPDEDPWPYEYGYSAERTVIVQP